MQIYNSQLQPSEKGKKSGTRFSFRYYFSWAKRNILRGYLMMLSEEIGDRAIAMD